MGEHVRYERRGTAAWITLSRPAQRNALSTEMIDGVIGALDAARADPAVRSVVLAADGPVFCAGADLTQVLGGLEDAGTGAVATFLGEVAVLFERVAAHPQPVIAAVHGAAIAGGLELVLACDLVVAGRSATFGDGHARYGLFPGGGGSVRLPRKIGANNAKWLMFTAEGWTADRMREVGLVGDVVEDDRLTAAVSDLADRIGRLSPLGLARMKDVVEAATDQPLADALARERAACENHAGSRDFAEGLRAFAARREPEFVGE